jgi:hypothetical protein
LGVIYYGDFFDLLDIFFVLEEELFGHVCSLL